MNWSIGFFDPTRKAGGSRFFLTILAWLARDRATMIYSQHDRVFMRSLATRGQAGGLSASTGRCLEILIESELFEVILVETVGTGQEAIPFGVETLIVDKA